MNAHPPTFILKRRARALSRSRQIPLHVALDQVAREQGFPRWSLLKRSHPSPRPQDALLAQLAPGDLVLLGARPGQGKTLRSLELVVDAVRQGRQAWFFSLVCNSTDLVEKLCQLGHEVAALGSRFHFDDSDEICARYLLERLQEAPAGTLVVIDYLQLLDEKRQHQPLQAQVSVLNAFAKERRLTIVFISQVDRRFDLSGNDFPSLADVRLPNPLDMGLFDKACFVNKGACRVIEPPAAASP